MSEKYLIWWTSQDDCERIVPLETWPTWLASEYKSRRGRDGRGRLWVHSNHNRAPLGASIEWDVYKNWLCKAAANAGGIVIPADAVKHVQFLPGFVTTFAMELPDA